MRTPTLENKADPAGRLEAARKRLEAVRAEIGVVATEAADLSEQLNEAYMSGTDAEVKKIREKRSAVQIRRMQLEQDREEAENAVQTARRDEVLATLRAELEKREQVQDRIREGCREMEALGRKLAELWDQYEADHTTTNQLNRRIEAFARQHGEEVPLLLPPVYATELTSGMLSTVARFPQQLRTLDILRERGDLRPPPPPPPAPPLTREEVRRQLEEITRKGDGYIFNPIDTF